MNKVSRQSLTDQVFTQLSEKIVSGEWPYGYRLPYENDLARELGVSRVSVRGAIQMLQTLGMVKTRVGSGTVVSHVNMDTVFQQLYQINAFSHDHRQINQVKSIMEMSCLRLDIQKKQPAKKIQHLQDILDEMIQDLENGDMEAYLKKDMEFHTSIVQMTENDLLIMIYQAIASLIIEESKWNTEQGMLKQGKRSIENVRMLHQASIDVLKTRDLNRCSEIFDMQIKEAEKLYQKDS